MKPGASCGFAFFLGIVLSGPVFAGVELEVGYSCVKTHGDGVWVQQGFSNSVDRCSLSPSLGWRHKAWSFGYTELVRVSSQSRATVRDVDYDSKEHRCLDRCNAPALFVGEGAVRGLFARRDWQFDSGTFVQVGALAFRPQWTIRVYDYRADGIKANPPRDARYDHRSRWQIAPSLGAGYRSSALALILRIHFGVKTTGDWVTGLFNGPAATLGLAIAVP